eukprot:CAMPEP_0181039104 /NCGR_PEP_ID=MMETSP1070-20121207/10288_1 /TAXON_ID=265543 /ORGANISM="Minutocellus polymorphus, Strain NH13" /LENGTH=120 /DNA_ID=CAMNT_0023116927 /DNA_START=29 /DNA_END=391 /DNA_ORIENTATION=+
MRAFLLLCMLASATAFFTGTPLQAGARQTAQRSSRSNMEMRARVCDLLGKRPNRQARVVTFSHKRNKTVQHVNLQTKRYFSDELGRNVKLRLSTKGMKTVTKYGGVDAAAKKFGLDLTKF